MERGEICMQDWLLKLAQLIAVTLIAAFFLWMATIPNRVSTLESEIVYAAQRMDTIEHEQEQFKSILERLDTTLRRVEISTEKLSSIVERLERAINDN
jgi:septal ring factor EnvC (AmiA/AmiB activator)